MDVIEIVRPLRSRCGGEPLQTKPISCPFGFLPLPGEERGFESINGKEQRTGGIRFPRGKTEQLQQLVEGYAPELGCHVAQGDLPSLPEIYFLGSSKQQNDPAGPFVQLTRQSHPQVRIKIIEQLITLGQRRHRIWAEEVVVIPQALYKKGYV